MERWRVAIERCRAQLEDLRQLVKSSTSYRERGALLLAAATEAVGFLDDISSSTDNTEAQKSLGPLADRVQALLDRGEAVVKVYGQLHGVEKLLSKSTVPQKYDEIIEQFQRVHQTARSAASESSQHGMLSVGSAPSSSAAQQMLSPHDISTGTIPMQQSIDLQTRTYSTEQSEAITSIAKQSNITIERSFKREKIRKGTRQELITAMVCVPAANPQVGMGHAWWFISRVFGRDKFIAHDLSSGVEQKIEGWSSEGLITVMHASPTGAVYTGHRNGAVIAWDEGRQRPRCSPVQVFNSGIRALTTDETGAVWAGSAKGEVKCLRLEGLHQDGAVLGTELRVLGSLQHTGSGNPELSAANPIDPNTGMVQSIRARERAHDGPVTALAAAGGRLWSSGGSAAFVCLREWTQRGEFINKHDLRSTGSATCIALCSPIVKVLSHGATNSSSVSSVPEVPQSWQLITSHGNGMIQVWGNVSGLLRPLLRIGERSSPITGLSIAENLGVVCLSHQDGMLTICPVPHPRESTALTVTYADRSVGSVSLPIIKIMAHRSGINVADSSPLGILTASNHGSVLLWSDSMLKEAASGTSIVIKEYPEIHQRPIIAYNSISATQAALLETSPTGSIRDLATTPSTALDAKEKSGAAYGDASHWMLEFSELTLVRKIGEGAFGQVYLGRWQETDVAVKLLTSLSAVGLAEHSMDGAKSAIGPEALRTLEREVGIMIAMRHPNIILFMGVCPEPPAVVTEYCGRGSLYDLLMSAKADPSMARQLDWGRRLGMALDAAKGMLYLHSHKPPIVHRDLKSPNLLVDRHWRVKVTDFNLSRITDTAANVQSSLVASNPRWLAPEVIRSQNFTHKSDVYAMGLILWELATWETPFANMTPFQIMLTVGEQGGRPEVPEVGSTELQGGNFEGWDEYVGLMKACWAQDPNQRPSFDQIIATLRRIAEIYTSARRSTRDMKPTPLPDQTQEDNSATNTRKPDEATTEQQPEDNPSQIGVPPVRSPFESGVSPFSSAAPNANVAQQQPRVLSPFDAPATTANVVTSRDAENGVVHSTSNNSRTASSNTSAGFMTRLRTSLRKRDGSSTTTTI